LVTISLLLALLLGEGFLRLIDKPNVRILGDPLLGHVPYPNRTAVWDVPEYGPAFVKHTNNARFYEDTDIPADKPAGTRRIVFVGDSQTEGLCANPNSYPHQLQALLQQSAKGGIHYEVINAGVGTYSPYQYYLRTLRDVLPYHPDHLVVGIYVGNDLVDLTRRDDRPYLTVDASGKIIEHGPVFQGMSDPDEPGTTLGRSRLYTLIMLTIGRPIRYQANRAEILFSNANSTSHGAGEILKYMFEVGDLSRAGVNMMTQCIHQQLWFRYFPETRPVALRLNRYVMERFQQLCRREGIQLTYIFLPTKARIEPQDIGVFPKFQDHGFTPSGSAAFEDEITATMMADCAALNIPALDLRAPLQQRKHNERLYYPRDMHLTVSGNRQVAEAIFEGLHERFQATF
jgi:lysophospholipase L1-like esterase